MFLVITCNLIVKLCFVCFFAKHNTTRISKSLSVRRFKTEVLLLNYKCFEHRKIYDFAQVGGALCLGNKTCDGFVCLYSIGWIEQYCEIIIQLVNSYLSMIIFRWSIL